MIDDEKDMLILTPFERPSKELTTKERKVFEVSERIVKEALAIEHDGAKESGNLGYLARILVQATMPHSKLPGLEFQRSNGNLTISIQAPSKTGLPYGHYPRLLLSWITTEAVKTKSPVLNLGNSLSAFLRQLGLTSSGGRWGTVPRLQDHMKRLFCSTVSWTYSNKKENGWASSGMRPVEEATLWWDPKNPDQTELFRSQILLNSRFFEEITTSPVPVDMRVLRALAHERSPMAIDIYTWMSYRLYYLKNNVTIPWEALALQFGGDYTRVRDFKKAFTERLAMVMKLYPEARAMVLDSGLKLSPSLPSVAPKLLK